MIAWLKLARVQTASLTMSAAIIAAIVSGGSWVQVAFCAVWALLFHVFAFADNNVCHGWYDAQDPNKSHFPLVTGEIALGGARKVAVWLRIAALVFSPALMSRDNVTMVMSGLCSTFAVVSVALYNRTCKKNSWGNMFQVAAPFLCIMSVCIAIGVTDLGILVAAYGAATAAYQCIEGALKDRDADGVNLANSIGDVNLLFLGTLIICSKGAILYVMGATSKSGIVLCFVMVALLLNLFITPSAGLSRKQTMRLFSLLEFIGYGALLMTLLPVLHATGVLLLLAGPAAWFVAANHILWGTMTPKV